MINEKRTEEKYGYTSNALAPTSNLPVLWTCEGCGEEREYAYAYCLKKQEKAQTSGGKELCQKCSHAHRKGVKTVKKNSGESSFMPLPPEVDVAATQERYGYDPRDLSPWSRKRVVVRCFETGEICSPRRCGLNRYKSIMETGHFISVGAWTAKRRKGVKASKETKAAMKKSQSMRRHREKTITPPSNPTPTPTVWAGEPKKDVVK